MQRAIALLGQAAKAITLGLPGGAGETGGIFKMAERIVNRMMKKQVEGNLARLKEILEAQAKAST